MKQYIHQNSTDVSCTFSFIRLFLTNCNGTARFMIIIGLLHKSTQEILTL